MCETMCETCQPRLLVDESDRVARIAPQFNRSSFKCLNPCPPWPATGDRGMRRGVRRGVRRIMRWGGCLSDKVNGLDIVTKEIFH